MRLEIDTGSWIDIGDGQFPTNTDTWPPMDTDVYQTEHSQESIEEKLDRIIALLERLVKK